MRNLRFTLGSTDVFLLNRDRPQLLAENPQCYVGCQFIRNYFQVFTNGGLYDVDKKRTQSFIQLTDITAYCVDVSIFGVFKCIEP